MAAMQVPLLDSIYFIQISHKIVFDGPIYTPTAVFHIKAWRQLSEYLKQWWANLLTHICVTRPRRVHGDRLIEPLGCVTIKNIVLNINVASVHNIKIYDKAL